MRFQFQSLNSHTQRERERERDGKLEISRFPIGFEFERAFRSGEVWGPLLGF